jgi:lysozyme
MLPSEPLIGITQAKADQLFIDDAERIARGLLKYLCGLPGQQQFDAVESLAFNEGEDTIGRSTLVALLNQGEPAAAANQFTRWKYEHVDGVLCESEGLLKRRIAEKRIFLDGVYDSRH